LIDGLMLALLSVLERGEKHRFLQALQAADSDEEAVEVIADEFDFVLEPIASEQKRYLLYGDVLEHLRDSQPRPVGFQREDFVEGLGAALVAIVAAMPALLPLWLLRAEPLAALRAANIVSFIILFFLGYRWGRYTGANPWKVGALLVMAGVLLMAIAIPLGG
jgi:VIT1/CCC1 family predicted Fe2+/Mn2+ transporter